MTGLPLKDLVATVAFVDPASGKKQNELKRVRARSAIVVLGLDVMARVFILHAWAARCSTTTLLDEIYRINTVFHPRPFGIESNAMQSLFVDCAAYIAAKFHRQRIALMPVDQSTHIDKDFRIRTVLQPVILQGRLFKREDMQELVAEVRTFPRSPLKDLVDALASALVLLPKVAGRAGKTSELDALAAYLREAGHSSAEISQRLKEAEQEMVGV